MLEDNLRTLFALEAEADPPMSHISVPAAGRSARMRQRQRRALTIGSPVLAAAAVIVVIATSVGLSGVAFSGGGERIARPTRTAMPPAAAGSASWTRIPRAPIAPRSEYGAVWTGKEMIVWGGYSGNTQYGDGAAYDPATRTWTSELTARRLLWRQGETVLYLRPYGTTPLAPASPHSVWTSQLAVYDLASRKDSALTSGLVLNDHLSSCGH